MFRSLKYSESSLILDIYTLEKGLHSFIVGGVRKAKSKMKNIFHPVNIIEFVAYDSDNRLSRIKEAGYALSYNRISSSVIHSSIAMFMIDLARNAIKENEGNTDMYNFLRQHLIELDKAEGGFSLLPHRFAIDLTRYLGFEPLNNYDSENTYFDMIEGAFVCQELGHPHILGEAMSLWMYKLMSDVGESQIDKILRSEILDIILKYYRLHIDGFKELKCLPVLRSVLS